jgi:hypothetical protein
MQQESSILRDVALRLNALADLARLRPMVAGALAHLREAKRLAATAEHASTPEQEYLREAAEVSRHLALLRADLLVAERALRRTAYLVELLSDSKE